MHRSGASATPAAFESQARSVQTMTVEEAGTDSSDATRSAAEAAEQDALKSVRAVGEDRGVPDTEGQDDTTTSPSEVDPDTGTDADGFPVENPSG